MSSHLTCRFCQKPLEHIVVDLGVQPVANDYIAPEHAWEREPFYPLTVFVCDQCWLVQCPTLLREDEIFREDYAYFSSTSSSWVEHAKQYVEMMISRFGFNTQSQVIELASNDGYLLQFFKENNIPVLGIDPCKSVADAAIAKSILTWIEFFGMDIAQKVLQKGKSADLVIANNVTAHVPDLNDFVAGMATVLKPSGIVTIEQPHLQQLIEKNQFDTMYHEHYSYYSLTSVQTIFAYHGLTVFDVEEIPTTGGSLRVFAQKTEGGTQSISPRVTKLLAREEQLGYKDLKFYAQFTEKVKETKRKFLEYIIAKKREGKQIVGYGAPAKGNTFLNYCGVRTDFLDYTVDKAPSKQGYYLPGTRIPIFSPAKLSETKPDLVVILPWNIKTEVMQEMAHVRDWGGKFVIAIPEVQEL